METKSKTRGNGRIKNDFFPIRVNVGPYLQGCIEQELKSDLSKTCSITSIVRDALELYFQSKIRIKVISETKPLEDLKNPETSSTSIPSKSPHMTRQEARPALSIVRLAERAKRRGEEYDQSMEQYFPLLSK